MSSLAKRPNGKWRARVTLPDGSQRARHFDRKVDAEQWQATQVHKLTEGTWVDPMRGRRTFGEYAEEWLAGQIHHRASTTSATRSRLKHLTPTFGHRPLASIQRSEVQSWVTERAQHLKPSTVEGLYRLLAQVMLAAVDDKMIGHSPCWKITLPEQDAGAVTVPAIEDVVAVAAAASNRGRALIATAVGTGMRISELCGLTVDRVDFLRRTVTVDRQLVGITAGQPRFGPPKTKAGNRVIPVGAELVDALAAHLARHPSGLMLFTTATGFPWRRQRLSDEWAGWCEAAGVSCRFHDLRHLYASTLISAGQSVKVIQQRMGHGSASVTLDTYGHLMPSDEEGTRQATSAAVRLLIGTGT